MQDKLKRRDFLKTVGLGAAALALPGCGPVLRRPGGEGAAAKANVLLVMTDDQGWGDVHSHGNSKIDTPVMDRLAGQGARFDRFFVSSVCAPTRASLLTGRYHVATGVTGVTRSREIMRSEEVTIAEVFRQNGYATGAFGKWHNGEHYPNHPLGQGFDEFFGFCGGHWNNYFDTPLEHSGRIVPTEGYITDVLTDAAIDFIIRNKDRPFFCYLPYNAPHAPFQVPDRYFEKYKQRGLDDKNAAVYGMVENIDDNLGRLLEQLDTLGLAVPRRKAGLVPQEAGNTVVIFLTDNGPNGSDRYNGGMKGSKGSVHEGGIRVPFFIRWPGRIPAGVTIEPIAAHIDLLPTLVDLLGLSMPEGPPLDGTSLAPLLRGQAAGWPDRMIFSCRSKVSDGKVPPYPGSVRTQRYRLVNGKGANWELYDMSADPGQKKDIAGEHPEIVQRLSVAYLAWFEQVTADYVDRPPIPVGYPEAPLVNLPAPESYFEGNIKYANGAGYAHDWFTGWESTEDSAWWDIDVVRPGQFEITLMYTCPPEDVGSRVQVAAGDHAVEGEVSLAVAHENRVRPDRTAAVRLVKDFAPLSLGVLQLDRGRTSLTVKALTRPGRQVFDLKAVRLRRVE